MSTQRVLFIPDTHVPYHDTSVWRLLLRSINEFEPHVLVVLGDFADFYAVSDHDKNPNRTRDLKVEVASVNQCIDQLDAFKKIRRKVFVKGNHEWRLERYLMRKAPELFNMVRVSELFNLDRRGWETVEYMDDARVGKIYVTHDTGKSGKVAHLAAQADYESNCVIGHTHQIGYGIVGNARGEPHVGAMFGWLGDFDSIDYLHRVKARRNWAHGFGVGYLRADGAASLVPVPVIRNSVCLEGTWVRSNVSR